MGEKRAFGGSGCDDKGADGYAQPLQAARTAAIRGWPASMVAECSAEQLLLFARSSSLHALKSAIAFVAVIVDEITEAALQRVYAAAAYRSEAAK